MGQQYSHLSSEERILIEKLHCVCFSKLASAL